LIPQTVEPHKKVSVKAAQIAKLHFSKIIVLRIAWRFSEDSVVGFF